MSELIENESTQLLTVHRADEIVRLCMNESISDADIYESLMAVIRAFTDCKSSLVDSVQMQAGIDSAKYISSTLRRYARKNKALRYYYYGMYHVKVDQLLDELIKKRTISKVQEVENRKYFSQIMTILYDREVVRQCDLAKELHIERANLSREMDLLIAAGLVEKRKTSKLSLYNLSARGYEYFNKYFLLKEKLEPSKSAAYRRLKSSTIRVELNFGNDSSSKEVQVDYLPSAEKKKMSDKFYLGLPEIKIDSNLSGSSLDETFELVEVTV